MTSIFDQTRYALGLDEHLHPVPDGDRRIGLIIYTALGIVAVLCLLFIGGAT